MIRPILPPTRKTVKWGRKNTKIWKDTEERNRATAKHYDKLGRAEYEAAEGCAKVDEK